MSFSLAALVVVGGCVAAFLSVAYYCRSHRWWRFGPAARQALLSDDSVPPAVLLLGPSEAGKSTIHAAACALAGEASSAADGGSSASVPALARQPTRGLVRTLLSLPASIDASHPSAASSGGRAWRRRHVVMCDAGGGRQERRQWVELVREPARVGCLVFVADARDASEDTRQLWKQLCNAKWARRATLLLALTHLDRLLEERGAGGAHDACAQREAEYRAAANHPFSTHVLDCRDATATARLLVEAVASAAPGLED